MSEQFLHKLAHFNFGVWDGHGGSLLQDKEASALVDVMGKDNQGLSRDCLVQSSQKSPRVVLPLPILHRSGN